MSTSKAYTAGRFAPGASPVTRTYPKQPEVSAPAQRSSAGRTRGVARAGLQLLAPVGPVGADHLHRVLHVGALEATLHVLDGERRTR